MDDIIGKYRSLKFKLYGLTGISILSSIGIPIAEEFLLFLPWEVIAGTTAFGGAVSSGLVWYSAHRLKDFATSLISEMGLETTFRQLYSRQIAENDEFTMSIWSRVRHHMLIGLTPQDLASFKRVRSGDFQTLQNLLEQTIPELRRKISPTINASSFVSKLLGE